MNRRPAKTRMSGVFVLLLTAVFAACVLMVLLTGAGVYRRLAERDRETADRRTAVQYVATKVRHADVLDAVSVEDFDGVDALVLREDYDGDVYLTRVYCYDGWLRELFAAAETELTPADGEKVLAAEALELTLENGVLTAVTAEDVLALALRSGEGAAP